MGRFAWVLCLCCLHPASAEDFNLTNVTINSQGDVAVGFPSDTNSYFALQNGPQVASITSTVALALGQAGGGMLTHGASGSAESFFSVRKVPLSNPLDSDGDGIDDAYELTYAVILNPLDPADAGLDGDIDQVDNLGEYQRGTDPTNSASVNIDLYADSVLGDDGYDGTRPLLSPPKGPKRTVQGALAVGITGDRVILASGTYPGAQLDSGPATISLVPQGEVVLQPPAP